MVDSYSKNEEQNSQPKYDFLYSKENTMWTEVERKEPTLLVCEVSAGGQALGCVLLLVTSFLLHNHSPRARLAK